MFGELLSVDLDGICWQDAFFVLDVDPHKAFSHGRFTKAKGNSESKSLGLKGPVPLFYTWRLRLRKESGLVSGHVGSGSRAAEAGVFDSWITHIPPAFFLKHCYSVNSSQPLWLAYLHAPCNRFKT